MAVARRVRIADGSGAARAARPRVTPPVEVRVAVEPVWTFQLRGGSPDGLLRRRGNALQRLIHVGDEPVFVGVVQGGGKVVFGARAATQAAAEEGIRRMRFATAVDDDLRPFYDQFRDDPLIGRSVRAAPHLRLWRRPDPWEALNAAITEQLIEFSRAVVIQRRLIAAFGRRCPDTGLRDAPAAARLAGLAPAELAAFDLPQHRAITLRRAAIEVASGRADLRAADHEASWRRLRSISGIGPWTCEMLAIQGQGRYDQIPAGDLGFIKLVGRITTGRPKARADEAEVRGFFERFGEWKGLAGKHLHHAHGLGWAAV